MATSEVSGPADDAPEVRPKRAWLRKPSVWVIPSLVLLLTTSAAVGMTASTRANDRADATEAELASMQLVLKETDAQVTEIERGLRAAELRADGAEAASRAALEDELENRMTELEDEAAESLAFLTADLEERAKELDDRGDALDEQEADLVSRESRLERTLRDEFGNGTWEVGVDIKPGRYRTVPGDRCYWARLRNRSGGVGSIVDNNNARGEQEIIVIASSDAYFESRNCGRWTPMS